VRRHGSLDAAAAAGAVAGEQACPP
jgi:hypothetical protein